MLITYFTNLFLLLKLSEAVSRNLAYLCLLCIIILLSLVVKFIFKHFLVKLLHSFIKQTATKWDDIFVENNVPGRVTLIIPAVVIFCFVDLLFPVKSSGVINLIHLICLIYIIIICVVITDSVLNSIVQIYHQAEKTSHAPVKSFAQMLKVIIVFVALVIIISMLMNKSPWTLLRHWGH